MRTKLILCAAGSSPRTWGTLHDFSGGGVDSRFIPTHVGNARSGRDNRRWRPVHPHARGERVLTNYKPNRVIGSSPRTWGTHAVIDALTDEGRFIPTHVGNAASPRWAAQ